MKFNTYVASILKNVYITHNTWHMAGGYDRYMVHGRWNGKSFKDILMYDSSQDKWTKTGELCRARGYHAMSLVPVESDIEDDCIVDQDCFF